MAKFTFNFTGATQTFAVPTGSSKATIKVWGGGGGGQVNIASTTSVAGAGGYSYGEAVFTPGQVLTIIVAAGGAYRASIPSAFKGGGQGGNGGGPGSGGGGMSSVAFQGQNPFIIAGGGGGAGIGNITTNLYVGGNGGGASGNDVILTNLTAANVVPAKGGTQSAGGAAGSYGVGAIIGSPGTSLQGGKGGTEGSGLNGGGGGGGGGLFGGGGGAGTNEQFVSNQQEQPGAGGSGFINTSVLQNATTQAAAAVTSKIVALPPNTSDPDYVTGIGIGPITDVAGGNGLVVIEFLAAAALSKTVDKKFAKVGDVLKYTLVIQNNPNTATNVIFVDTIPSNTSFNQDSLTFNGGPLTGQNPNPPGVNIGTVGTATSTITFSVTVTTLPTSNVVSNIGTISGTNLDVTNSDIATTTIVSGTLNSTKQVSKVFANIGDVLTYTIPISNSGSTTVSNIIFLDTIPNGTALVSNSFKQDGTSVSGTPNSGVTLPNSIKSGGITTVTFQVTVTTVPVPNPIPNTASAIGTFIVDPTTTPNTVGTSSSNTNTVNTQINFANLSGMRKLVDKSFATCGETISYTIVIPNSGTVTALNVVFKDTIPNGTALIPTTVLVNGIQQTNAFPQTGVTIPNIAPGTAATVNFSVLIQC